MNNRTFAIIKPDAVKNGDTGKIYNKIIEHGFEIISAKLLKMSLSQAEGFYSVHKERPFFNELTSFMTSGPCMVLALKKENAVKDDLIIQLIKENQKLKTENKIFKKKLD